MAFNEMQVSDGRAVYPPTTPTWEHTFTVNGELKPVFTARPGETQFWQVGNLGANTYFLVEVEGHGFTVVETDGGLLYTTYTANELFLYQGRRMGVAITASTRPGDYRIRTLGWDGGVFNNYTATDLAVLRVEGPPVHDPTPPHIPKHPRAPNKALFVPSEDVAAYRTFILSENSPTAETPEFYINSMLFSDRTPEWTPQVGVATCGGSLGGMRILRSRIVSF
jgi:suppressor of ftsI